MRHRHAQISCEHDARAWRLASKLGLKSCTDTGATRETRRAADLEQPSVELRLAPDVPDFHAESAGKLERRTRHVVLNLSLKCATNLHADGSTPPLSLLEKTRVQICVCTKLALGHAELACKVRARTRGVALKFRLEDTANLRAERLALVAAQLDELAVARRGRKLEQGRGRPKGVCDCARGETSRNAKRLRERAPACIDAVRGRSGTQG